MFNGVQWNVFPLRSGIRQGGLLFFSTLHLSFLAWAIWEGKQKLIKMGERSQISVCI